MSDSTTETAARWWMNLYGMDVNHARNKIHVTDAITSPRTELFAGSLSDLSKAHKVIEDAINAAGTQQELLLLGDLRDRSFQGICTKSKRQTENAGEFF